MSCDMFYVEVLLEPDGRVRDVKVELAGDQSTHEGLVSCCLAAHSRRELGILNCCGGSYSHCEE